jgi:ssDNA-specific exonuclease RecJ
MIYFHTKNPDLGPFLEGIGMDSFGLFYGHLVYFSHFGIMYKTNLAALAYRVI